MSPDDEPWSDIYHDLELLTDLFPSVRSALMGLVDAAYQKGGIRTDYAQFTTLQLDLSLVARFSGNFPPAMQADLLSSYLCGSYVGNEAQSKEMHKLADGPQELLAARMAYTHFYLSSFGISKARRERATGTSHVSLGISAFTQEAHSAVAKTLKADLLHRIDGFLTNSTVYKYHPDYPENEVDDWD